MQELVRSQPTARPSTAEDEQDNLRILSRSPHPYHRLNYELLEPADRIGYSPANPVSQRLKLTRTNQDQLSSAFSKESTPLSDSGTEADDEHFLRRLPAPKVKLHKGLRGKNESLSGSSTPLLSPLAFGEEEEARRKISTSNRHDAPEGSKRAASDRMRRRKEVLRRVTEVLLLIGQGSLIWLNDDARGFLIQYRTEFIAHATTLLALVALYPFRVLSWAWRNGRSSKILPISVPVTFDPAPILYPPLIPIFVSLLTAANTKAAVLPNLVLTLCTLPRSLIPATNSFETYSHVHWILSCIPLVVSEHSQGEFFQATELPREILVLLYPLHQVLCLILHHLTTTSLLTAELQLLSVSLINVFLLAYSPQAIILKSLLWIGGVGITILCGQVIRWGISLARVPKWRFRRAAPGTKISLNIRSLWRFLFARKVRKDFLGSELEDTLSESGNSSDEDYETQTTMASGPAAIISNRRRTGSVGVDEVVHQSPVDGPQVRFNATDITALRASPRRHTLPTLSTEKADHGFKTHTPSGRRKRSASFSVRAFFTLTQQQAMFRKWLYAGWVYASIIAVVLIGIREYVQRFALGGNEPIGWALGYLFGDIPRFRFEVVKANLEKWICLPERASDPYAESCYLGWIEHLRHASIGQANTRLVLCAYCLVIIFMGLAVVFQLSPIYEVDTRRKVFHFMMVAMFLPSIFVDPAFVALALSLMLAIFLLLDLLRASQLPPLSKPIATFLTPYVDGRDLRGPVVISHIFLLIGCAIPLWLSLAALPRSGSGYLAGWELPTRDVSMVSGVVCVGLGDAAASLIGRRWGHRKWFWGGGKSLEGSAAFATAVFVGLMAASAWLRVGGWLATSDNAAAAVGAAPGISTGVGIGDQNLWSWLSSLAWSTAATARRTGVCASLASVTEAVLTGGNDNVVVPVVLWTCVKSTGI